MKYRTTQPFIAFGKVAEVGDIVELTEDQAAALREVASVAPYEIKILPTPENKVKKKPVKKPSVSSRPARPSRKKTAKRSKKTAKK